MGHALLSPSSSYRWLNCTGSARQCESYPNKDSIHSWRGTVLHEMAELMLSELAIPSPGSKFICPDDESIVYELTTEDIGHVETYVDWVLAESKRLHVKPKVENKLDMGDWIPEGSGTGDVVFAPFDEIVIVDAKFGTGVKVDADSPQLLCYGIAAYDEFGSPLTERVRCVVVQPGLNHVSEHTYTIEEIEERRQHINKQALLAWNGAGGLKAGPWCKKTFCPHIRHCDALQAEAMAKARDVFTAEGEAADVAAGTSNLSDAMLIVPALEEWIKAIKAQVRAELELGNSVPGFKLVEGRRSFKWLDEDKVEEYLRLQKVKVADMMSDPKLKSVAQMRKQLKDNDKVDIEQFIETTRGQPSIAEDSDNRRTITSRAEVIFSEVTK